MSYPSEYIKLLLEKILSGSASSEQWDTFLDWMESDDNNQRAALIAEQLGCSLDNLKIPENIEIGNDDTIDGILRSASQTYEQRPADRKIARGKIKRFQVFKIAAAIALPCVMGLSYFLYNRYTGSKSPLRDEVKKSNTTMAAIQPGSNKAVLTLSNGTAVVLSDSTAGVIARQGGSVIQKDNNGKITYSTRQDGQSFFKDKYNTLATPRGGQYAVQLPDGTKVWLNAQTSLKYPLVFSDDSREVFLEGEAYFEVSKQVNKSGSGRVPFIVNIVNHNDPDLSAKVEVLGTHFNVQAYPDEKNIKTTLLEGKVNFYQSSNSSATKLLPGFQAVDEIQKNDVSVDKVNLTEAIAWKNGFFDFNELDLTSVLSQLSRWYDIDVVYKGKIPDIKFYGKMQRSLNLSEVLSSLELEGVHFELQDGKKLVVTQ